MSYPTPNIYYSVGGSPPFIPDSRTVKNTNEPYLEWLHWILALKDEEIPKTITTSYGDDEQTASPLNNSCRPFSDIHFPQVPQDYQITVCNLFAQLGARGVSILFSSGDVGYVTCSPHRSKSNDWHVSCQRWWRRLHGQ